MAVPSPKPLFSISWMAKTSAPVSKKASTSLVVCRSRSLAEDAPPVARIAPPDQPEARLSLTLPVLRGAGAVHVLIAGTAKRAALERVTEAGSAASLAALLGHAQIHYAE